MLAFYREYPYLEFVPQAVAQIEPGEKVTQAAALFPADLIQSIPWGHHTELMAKVKDLAARLWYMQACLANGWSRNILVMQIEVAAHQRQGRATTNFDRRLPLPDSDLVQQTLKDPYLFDFLTLESGFHERELETGLIAHLEKFLLELGQGFAFVGRQYHLDVGDQDFYVDLLFYHLKLRCYVVIDLKRGDFKPEYAGKMNLADSRTKCNKDEPGDGWLRMSRHHGHLNRQVQVARCTSTSAEKNDTKFTAS